MKKIIKVTSYVFIILVLLVLFLPIRHGESIADEIIYTVGKYFDKKEEEQKKRIAQEGFDEVLKGLESNGAKIMTLEEYSNMPTSSKNDELKTNNEKK